MLEKADNLDRQARWLDETIVEMIISEAQNEVADFKKWDIDIIPHRARMKQGFDAADGERVDVETAFKDADHPFRVAIVCAMWLTGFDVESLSTLYIDKPMKAHKVFLELPTPPFTDEEKALIAGNVYAHVWQQAMSGNFASPA